MTRPRRFLRIAFTWTLCLSLLASAIPSASQTGPSDFTETVLDGNAKGNLRFDRVDADTTFACTNFGSEVFQFNDEGTVSLNTTFVPADDARQSCDVEAWDTSNVAISYIESGSVFDAWIALSSDGGNTWNQTEVFTTEGGGGFDATSVVWTAENRLVFFAWDSTGNNLWVSYSNNTGGTWTVPSQFNHDPYITSDPSFLPSSIGAADGDPQFLMMLPKVDNTRVWSTDGGASWQETELNVTDPVSSATANRFYLVDTNEWALSYENDNGDPGNDGWYVRYTQDGGASYTKHGFLPDDGNAPNPECNEWDAGLHATDPTHVALSTCTLATNGTDDCSGDDSVCPALYFTNSGAGNYQNVTVVGDTDAECGNCDWGNVIVHGDGGLSLLTHSDDNTNELLYVDTVTVPGVDLLSTPTETDTLNRQPDDLRTDWSQDQVNHNVYVKTLWTPDRDPRIYVYDNSLAELRSGRGCTSENTVEMSGNLEFQVVRQLTDQLVYPCGVDAGNGFGNGFALIDPVLFQVIQGTNLDDAASESMASTHLSCGDRNNCIAANQQGTSVARFDPLNAHVNWTAGFSNVEDVAVDLNHTPAANFTATGQDATREWGTSGAVHWTDTTVRRQHIAACNDRVYVASSVSTRSYDRSATGLALDTINLTLEVPEDGDLRLSKDCNWLMGYDEDDSELWIADATGEDNLRKVVQVNLADVAGFDMDGSNSALYTVRGSNGVVEKWDLTGTNVTLANTSEPGSTAGGEVAIGGGAAPSGPAFDTILEGQIKSIFGVGTSVAGYILGALLISALAITVGAVISNQGGNPTAGATIGALGGVAFSWSMGWWETWFILAVATVAAAILVSRG